MPKTTTFPATQTQRVPLAYWTAGDGTIRKTLQVAGADWAGGADGAILKSLIVTNNQTATASVMVFGLVDPAQPVITATTIVATSTTAATVVATSGGSAADTTALAVGMLVSGTNIVTGTYISAIVSSSALTLSRASTGVVSGVTFIPWVLLGHVNVPLKSGGDAAGAVANIDLLAASIVLGFPVDQSGRPIVNIPAGYKIAAFNMTAVAASNGGIQVIAQVEEF